MLVRTKALIIITSFSLLLSCTKNNPVLVNEINPTNIYGSYSAGCIDGAIALDQPSQNYIIAPETTKLQRIYSHPELKEFLEEYSKQIYLQTKKPLIIGDLSNLHGGPLGDDSNHTSHQTGLDVDIFFSNDSTNLQQNALINDHIDPKALLMLKTAANNKSTDRILVNPAIKRNLCLNYSKEKWLNKIRPWYGHNEHFHLRLKCPTTDSAECIMQSPIPSGNGCDESLDWWFSDEAQNSMPKKKATNEITLPSQCYTILNNPK